MYDTYLLTYFLVLTQYTTDKLWLTTWSHGAECHGGSTQRRYDWMSSTRWAVHRSVDPRLQTTESSEPASNNARRWRVIRQTPRLWFQAPKFQDSDRDQYLKVQDPRHWVSRPRPRHRASRPKPKLQGSRPRPGLQASRTTLNQDS